MSPSKLTGKISGTVVATTYAGGTNLKIQQR
ncbi:hypothetical protein LINGRAPRIM_LOCUS3073 [Linum grandiflorum]